MHGSTRACASQPRQDKNKCVIIGTRVCVQHNSCTKADNPASHSSPCQMTPTQPSFGLSGGHISDHFCAPGPGLCSKDETRLVKHLFTGYNKVVRPINHFSEAVVVTVGLQLIQLISVVRDGKSKHKRRNTHTLNCLFTKVQQGLIR